MLINIIISIYKGHKGTYYVHYFVFSFRYFDTFAGAINTNEVKEKIKLYTCFVSNESIQNYAEPLSRK